MNIFFKIVILSIAVIFTSACSNQSSEVLPDYVLTLDNVIVHDVDLAPASSISLTEIISIGNSDDVLIGRIQDVEIDECGNIYFSEISSGNEAVFVFDSEGNRINKIGRPGAGPGEFRSIVDMKIHKDQLFVLDFSLLRIQIFDIDNPSLVHEASLNPAQWDHTDELSITYPLDIYVLNDSTIMTSFFTHEIEINTKSYYHLDLDGDVISDRILIQDVIRNLINPKTGYPADFDPFGGRGLFEVSTENEIFTVWSDEILFKVYDKNGSYLRAFYHPFKNSTLSRNEALNYNESENFRSALQHDGIPDYWRALEHMILDDENRLWISTITDNREVYKWWVMDKYGNLIARIELPRSVQIKTVKNDFLYTLESDKETGLQQIVKYHLEWESLHHTDDLK